jgi:hypothetical protein
MTPPKDTTIIYWRFSCLVCICSVISKMLHRYTPLYLSSINNNKMSTKESLRSQRKINEHCSCSWPNALDSSKVQSSRSCTTRDIQYNFQCHNAYTRACTHTNTRSLSFSLSLSLYFFFFFFFFTTNPSSVDWNGASESTKAVDLK